MRRITDLHDSAHFTIPLKPNQIDYEIRWLNLEYWGGKCFVNFHTLLSLLQSGHALFRDAIIILYKFGHRW